MTEPPPPPGFPECACPCVEQILVETPDWEFPLGRADGGDELLEFGEKNTPLHCGVVREATSEWSRTWRYRHYDGLSPAVVLSENSPWPRLQIRSVDVVARADAPELQISDLIDTGGTWVARLRLRVVPGADGVCAVEGDFL